MRNIFIMMFIGTVAASAQWRNVQVNQPGGLNPAPEEVTIAVNPVDPMNILAGSNLRSVYYSFDGGLTWVEDTLARDTYCDPSVTFDAGGRAYYAHLSTRFEAIYVRHSDDGGRTWSLPAKLRGPSSDSARPGLYRSSLQDKEWIATDLSQSQYRGNIYVAWTDFTKYGSPSPNDSTVIVFARSTDRGKSFESYVRVSDKGGNAVDSDDTVEGAVPAVGPEGEVYLAWAGPDGLYFDRSFDGGATFGKDSLVTATPGGWVIEIRGIYRCNGLPVTCADISNSQFRGAVYINWVDLRNGDPDVFIVRSTDRGTTWTGPRRVNDDEIGNGKEQFFSWMTVDPVTGEISIVFYDRRRYAGDSTDVYIARSTDGGETFVNTRISDAAFYPTTGVFFGDYNCISAYNGRIRPIWTELSNGVLSIHTALIESGSVGVAPPRAPNELILHQNYPNPFSSGRAGTERASTTIRYEIPAAGYARLDLVDMLGRTVLTPVKGFMGAGTHTVTIHGRDLDSGMYLCRLASGGAVRSMRMICLQ